MTRPGRRRAPAVTRRPSWDVEQGGGACSPVPVARRGTRSARNVPAGTASSRHAKFRTDVAIGPCSSRPSWDHGGIFGRDRLRCWQSGDCAPACDRRDPADQADSGAPLTVQRPVPRSFHRICASAPPAGRHAPVLAIVLGPRARACCDDRTEQTSGDCQPACDRRDQADQADSGAPLTAQRPVPMLLPSDLILGFGEPEKKIRTDRGSAQRSATFRRASVCAMSG